MDETWFEKEVRRENCGSLKWEMTPAILRQQGIVTFAAGEMDFPTAPAFCRAIREAADNGLFGFTLKDQQYTDHVCWWLQAARGWEILPEWIVPAYGTIYSLATAIKAFVAPHQRIIVQPPYYSRYKQAADRLGRGTVYNPLRLKDGQYRMDLQHLEKLMQDEDNRLLVLCNPHNPSGRVFSREELGQVAELSRRYRTFVFCDEIFAETVLDGEQVTPYVSLPEAAKYGMVCTSFGKTFNATGMNHANVLLPDEELRERFTRQRTSDHYGSIDPIAYAATIGAYSEEGLDWVRGMSRFIKDNAAYTAAWLETKLPQFHMLRPQGGFVCWIDFAALGVGEDDLEEELLAKALFHIDPGINYGDGYGSWARMNLATTRKQLQGALERLCRAYGSEG